MKYTTKHIDNYVVIVSDEEIKVGQLYLTSDGRIVTWIQALQDAYYDMPQLEKRKPIVFQSKPIHPNIPVFDIPVECGVDVEKLAIQFSNDNWSKFNNWYGCHDGFVAGYNKRAETHLFTMEDMRNCWNYAGDFSNEHTTEGGLLEMNFDKFTNEILKPQEYQVEIEMEEKEYQVQFTDGAWSRTIATRLIPKIIDGKIKIIKWNKI